MAKKKGKKREMVYGWGQDNHKVGGSRKPNKGGEKQYETLVPIRRRSEGSKRYLA